jgi:hypothetical protein
LGLQGIPSVSLIPGYILDPFLSFFCHVPKYIFADISQNYLTVCHFSLTDTAKDTNIIISHPEIDCFHNFMNDIFCYLNKGIKGNKFPLNFDKTIFMKFCTNNKTCVNLNTGYDDRPV